MTIHKATIIKDGNVVLNNIDVSLVIIDNPRGYQESRGVLLLLPQHNPGQFHPAAGTGRYVMRLDDGRSADILTLGFHHGMPYSEIPFRVTDWHP